MLAKKKELNPTFDFGKYMITENLWCLFVGLKEGKSACCGSGKFRGEYSCGGKRGQEHFELCDKPNEYLFWDAFHPTESAYKQLAARMWSSNTHPIGFCTIRDLFQAQ